MSIPVLASTILLLALLSPAAAGAAGLGTPFAVASCTDCRQSQASVAGAPSGRFVVVWEGASPRDAHGILRRLFEPAGSPRGGEALVNRNIPPEQYDSAVAADARGYVAVWTEEQPGGGSILLAQRFRPLGSRLGGPIAVSADPPGGRIDNFNPAVARTPDGGFVVAGIRFRPVGAAGEDTDPEVYARGFSAAGVALGPPARVSASLASGNRPDLCADAAGRVVAAWTTVDAFRPFEPSLEGVSARRLARSGAPVGNELVVARPLARQAPAAVSCGKAGFVVAWASDQAPAVHRTDVLARRFTVRGRGLGPTLVVNSATEGDQRNPAISHDRAGNFVVVWQDFAARALQARRFAANGVPAGEQFQVRTDPSGSTGPAEPDLAHVGAGGTFVVVWREAGGLFGRLVSQPAGAAVMRAEVGEGAAIEEPEEAQIVGSMDW
jgi:hypothetical protein